MSTNSQDTFNKLKYGSRVPELHDNIKHVMDELQHMFEANVHITDPSRAADQLSTCSMYLSHMNDEDNDYYQGCKWALENQHKWDLDATVDDEELHKLQEHYQSLHNTPRVSTDGKFNLIWDKKLDKWVADPVQLKEYLKNKK